MKPLRDLEPRYDVKGGSPKTPIPIPVKDLQGYIETGDSDGLWKAATTGACGLFIGMTVAWFTALQNKGVTQTQMAEAIAHDRELIATQNQNRDEKIGGLLGHKDRIFDRLKMIEEKHITYDRDMAECDSKIKMLTNYIEAEKFPKK